MQRRNLANPSFIIGVLILQLIPLVLFPASSFGPKTQEWWLPVLLLVMVIVSDVYLIVFHTAAPWPWTLMSFAQGVNIISRLMLIWPHATTAVNKVYLANLPYVALSLLSMLLSVFVLWYTELPDVRMGLVK